MGGTVKRNQLDHFVSVESLTNEEVLNLIKRAEEFKNGAIPQDHDDKYAVNLFFENSTRTKRNLKFL